MGHPTLESDVSNLPSGHGATIASMKQEVRQKRYMLDTWFDNVKNRRHGIVPALASGHGAIQEKACRATAVDWSGTTAQHPLMDPRSSACKHDRATNRWRLRGSDILLLLLVTGAFGTVLAYYLVSGDNGFNRFFNSSTFGPRFILTSSATVIANLWGNVEQNSMVMAPFIRLANGPASFDALSFAPTITPVLSTWRALSHRYWVVGIVTFMTLLAEVLSIAISGVPFSTGQTWLNFLVVTYISLAILGVMILVAVVVIAHRRREPKVSVVPDTLGAKMSYLAGSKMLLSFDGSDVSYGGNSLRSRRFIFQFATGEDGRRCWQVDQLQKLGEQS